MAVISSLTVSTFNDTVELVGNSLVDSKTKEKVLSFERITQAEINSMRNSGDLVSSKFGGVNGYESVSSPKKNKSNFWIVCDKSKACYKFESSSEKNILAPSLIGTFGTSK